MSKNKKFPLFAHEDGKRSAKRLYIPPTVKSAEEATQWLQTHGWSVPKTGLHVDKDGKFVHVGKDSDCPLCRKHSVELDSNKVKAEVSSPIPEKDNKEIAAQPKIEDAPASRKQGQSEKVAPTGEKVPDGIAYMLKVTPAIGSVHNVHSTIFFNNDPMNLDFLKEKVSFKVKLQSLRVLGGPAPGLVVTYKPSEKMNSWRSRWEKKIKHNNDFLPHITLKYGANETVPEGDALKQLKLPKEVTLSEPFVKEVFLKNGK